MMNVGVSGSVRLEWTDKPVRPERFVPPATLSEDLCGGGRWRPDGLSRGCVTSPALENMRVHVARTSEKVATVDAHTLPSYMVIIYIGCMDTGIRPSDATGFGRDEHNVLKN